MPNYRAILFFATIIFVILGGIVASYFARGYRLDPTKGGLKQTGIFVATSSPDGAQIIVNGELESATNATISLVPNTYDVEIRKEGYLSWKKRLTIKAEEVTKVDTTLFPAAPSLSPITFGGAIRPTLSPDGNKLVFGIPQIDKTAPEKSGIFVMDLSTLPIGFSSEPRRITNILPDDQTSWVWSPDGRDVLIFNASGAYIAHSYEYTADTSLINIQGARLEKILKDWQAEQTKKRDAIIASLPQTIQDFFTYKVERLSPSFDQKKILYVAAQDTAIPDNVIPQIPGSSTQKQDRTIKKGNTYIYDIKEDRNFLIYDAATVGQSPRVSGANPMYGLESTIATAPAKTPKNATANVLPFPLQTALSRLLTQTASIFWYPSSLNVVIAEPNKVTIADYDGTNKQVVFAGPYESPYAIPAPSGTRLLLLTHFGAGENNLTNLYSLGLK